MEKIQNTIPDYQSVYGKRSIKNYISGALSSFGTSGFSAMLFSSWLTYVYTEYLGVNAAAIAVVVSVGVIIDGVSDFIMGIVMDRVTTKWGKAKHWFFISTVPIGVTMILMWMVPQSIAEVGKIAYAFVLYTLFCILLTTVRMSAQAFPTLVSDNTKIRSNMAYAMNITASLSSAALGWIIAPVTNIFGQNLTAYRILAVICGVITMACLFASGVLLTEQRNGNDWEKLKKEYRVHHNKEKNESVIEQIKNLFQNKYWILYLFISLLSGCGVFFGFGVMAYWMKYVLNDMSKIALITTVLNIPCLVGTFLFLPISRKFDIKTIAVATTFIEVVCGIVMWVAGANLFTILIVGMAIKSFFGGVQAPVAMVIIPHIVDYGEWKTGSRQEGMCNAGTAVASKIMSALATVCVGFVLSATGYNGGGVAPAAAISAINFLFLGLPTIAIGLSGVLWIFFKLNDKQAEQYRAEIKARKDANTTSTLA